MRLSGVEGILQVHVTRRCNLRCLHCYSDSSPEATDALPIDVAVALVGDAAPLGYSVLSVSGGEPFMYRALPRLLEAAKAAGMRTQVISNGLAVTRARLAAVTPWLDLLAISVDGESSDHDRMRGLAGALDRVESRLRWIGDTGVPLGLLFTLTQFNVHQVAWAADLAAASGARLLQIHPLEATGRASALADEVPDETEGLFALVEAARLRRHHGDRLKIHVDVATVGQLRRACEMSLATEPAHFADAVSPLVVEPDGACVPLEYGFPRGYALGTVVRERLPGLSERWLAQVGPTFRRATQRLLDDLERRPEGVVVNVYEAFRSALPAVTPLRVR